MNRRGRKSGDSENGELITRAAFELLMEKGYTDTSYADIARRCGRTRSLVQYYYPKKELILSDFVLRLLQLSEDYLQEHDLGTDSCFVDFSITGYMHFCFLLNNEDLRPLTLDISSLRSASSSIIELMESWVIRYDELSGFSSDEVLDAVLLSMGGAYEFMNYHLKEQLPIDVADLLRRTIAAFMFQLGFDTADFEAEFETHLLSDEVIADANEYILAHICEP